MERGAETGGEVFRGPPHSVVLVGPRGAGKTTLARILAALLGWAHTDTDDLIAATVGTPAGEFLTAAGEPKFRSVEADLVGRALDTNRQRVLALGGGAVGTEETRNRLSHPAHFVVFLFAPVPQLAERVKSGTGRPPLTSLPPEEEVARLFRDRLPLYRSVCDFELDTFSSDAGSCARTIAANMGFRPT